MGQPGFFDLSDRLNSLSRLGAAMRADAMMEKGDLDGYAVWKRIVKATEELLSKERPDGATLQSVVPISGRGTENQ